MFFVEMDLLSYLTYFVSSIVMITIFLAIYIPLTPYDEIALIRQGQGAAAISLTGTVIGFSLTLAASAIYHATIMKFIAWAVVSMMVQLIGYLVIVKLIGNVTKHIQQNNMAVGSLIGLTGLVLGIINAGCLS